MPLLSRRSLGLLALLLGTASLALAAPGKERLALLRKTRAGDRLLVKEKQHTETRLHWKGEGQGSAGGEEVEDVEREFVQEVVSESPLVRRRDYKVSTRRKGKPQDDSLEAVRTSVHGKTVVVRDAGPTIEGGEISKEDRENLDTVERLAYSLLPKGDVAVGEDWKVSDEVGRALFRGMFDPENVKSHGTARLEGLKTVEGRRAARLLLKLSVQVVATEVVPAIVLELKGSGVFLVDEGVFADCSLEGPIRFESKKKENGREVSFSSEGTTAYKLHGEPLLGAAKKPLAKEDDLARAKAVQCANGHKLPNEFPHCGSCGKPLDAATRRCPGGCPPLLRFCPLCGEPLEPVKDEAPK